MEHLKVMMIEEMREEMIRVGDKEALYDLTRFLNNYYLSVIGEIIFSSPEMGLIYESGISVGDKERLVKELVKRYIESYPDSAPPFEQDFIIDAISTMINYCYQEQVQYDDLFREGSQYEVGVVEVKEGEEVKGYFFYLYKAGVAITKPPFDSVEFKLVEVEGEKECATCLEKVEKEGVKCNCGNYFHPSCLKPQRDTRCPLCREDMLRMDQVILS